MQPDFTGDRIHFLVVFELQVDDAVLADALDRFAGLSVQREHLVARRDVDDPVLAAVSPVRDAAA
jgi:hypothetical protein